MTIPVKMLPRLAAILSVLLVSTPAWADIDYRCLTLCKNAGGITGACVNQCSYTPKAKTATPKGQEGKAHNTFDAPVSPSVAAATPRTVKPPVDRTLNTSHVCIQSCMRDGLQYGMCEAQCTEDATLATPTK